MNPLRNLTIRSRLMIGVLLSSLLPLVVGLGGCPGMRSMEGNTTRRRAHA